MKRVRWERAFAALGSAAVLAALAACGDRVENTEMPQPPQASVEINRQGMEGARDSNDAVGVQNHGTAVVGAGAAPVAAPDDADHRIAADVKNALVADPDFAAMKVDVHSREGAVTLIGRAPDPAAKDRATDIARNVRDVKSVENLLTLG